MTKRLAVLTTALTLVIGAGGATAAAAPQPAPEIFATNNTSVITDPDDPRLKNRLIRFDAEVRGIVATHGGHTTGSTLLDGVFWSSSLQQTTYERSRKFDVRGLGTAGLRHTADTVRKRFNQESVLTFEFLPRTSPRADAVQAEIPGVTAQQLRTGLANDPEAREKLGGGSVTLHDKLILVADENDLALVRRFVEKIGGDWEEAEVRTGAWEFVSAESSQKSPQWSEAA
ncbi:hypothetical protein FKR81_25565 [Lentzea tibetensis]|uniref:Secreted protein n=1 Tax=Lentzea tibetensis TaxID=2591470 RepID=A0A563EP41_9PSEU|nr:hypothetical protein [Lentzea tibetensis]TWP49046.1 hypothetical protein FKR81_25565 [Lentzea tibetensis]